MSENISVETDDGQILAAQYKDGQLQIVEVTPFDKTPESILPDISESGQEEAKYMQVLDTGKGLVQLDLLNLTLVKCDDGEDGYQLVANAGTSHSTDMTTDSTVSCVLQSSDNEVSDADHQETYVMVDGENGESPLVFLNSAIQHSQQQKMTQKDTKKTKALTPAEILERAKLLQRAKGMTTTTPGKRGRKRKSDLPPPHELLSSPNFRLYLYNCKMCSFKCNAVKEMSAHKAEAHGGGRRGAGAGAGAGAGGGARGGAALQCARCPYRAHHHAMLMKHVQEKHSEASSSVKQHKEHSITVNLDTEEVEAADVLVCGACGFESDCRQAFRTHIEDEHGATTL